VVRHTHHPLLYCIQVIHNSNLFYFKSPIGSIVV
jgi:hypothetical protein